MFSIFSDISKAKELVLYLSFSSFIEVDIWLTFDNYHYWPLWARKLLLLLRCGKPISQKKILWIAGIALEFENNGNGRQSRLQEYAENVLESCLDNISGSNLSKGMTKASFDMTCHVQKSVSSLFIPPSTIAVALWRGYSYDFPCYFVNDFSSVNWRLAAFKAHSQVCRELWVTWKNPTCPPH